MERAEASPAGAHLPLEERIRARVKGEVESDPRAAVVAAQEQYAEAREHKREAEHHRRKAKKAFISFDAFKRELEKLGIEVVVEPASKNVETKVTNSQRRASEQQGNQATH